VFFPSSISETVLVFAETAVAAAVVPPLGFSLSEVPFCFLVTVPQ